MARKGIVTFDIEACKGCVLCVAECSFDVLEMSSTVNAKGYTYPLVKIAENYAERLGDILLEIYEQIALLNKNVNSYFLENNKEKGLEARTNAAALKSETEELI